MDTLDQYLETGEYDFLDFGCSGGGSLAFGKKILGGTQGLGLDISPSKVATTREAGFSACVVDVREVAFHSNNVRFVTMLDFLEHLYGFDDAKRCVEAACSASREFIYIKQPWFDADGYLFARGLKFYWSDWTGHRFAMTTLDFHRIMGRIGEVKWWKLYGCKPVTHSDDPTIHGLASPINQHHWEKGIHPKKPSLAFDLEIFQQVVCIATLDDRIDITAIESRVPRDRVLFDSKIGPVSAPQSGFVAWPLTI